MKVLSIAAVMAMSFGALSASPMPGPMPEDCHGCGDCHTCPVVEGSDPDRDGADPDSVARVKKGCNHDNILRALLIPTLTAQASAFCSTFIQATQTVKVTTTKAATTTTTTPATVVVSSTTTRYDSPPTPVHDDQDMME